MKLIDIWISSVKAIFNNSRRSILSIIGIVIGIAAVITVVALGQAYNEHIAKQITQNEEGEVIITVGFYPNDPAMDESNVAYFYQSDFETIETIDGVDTVSRTEPPDNILLSMTVEVNGDQVSANVRPVEGNSTDVVYGRSLTAEDNELHNKVAVIPIPLAEAMYGSAEAALGMGVKIDDEIFTIVGVKEGNRVGEDGLGDIYIDIPSTVYYDYFEYEIPYETLEVTILPGYDPEVVAADITEQLNNYGVLNTLGDYNTSDNLGNVSYNSAYKTGAIFLIGIASIALLISGVGIMNMMYTSVAERSREIGIRRAMGASANAIRLQFLIEGVTLTLLGGIVGYFVGVTLANILSRFLGLSVGVSVNVFVVAFVISVFIGVIFSVIPASKAAKKDIIDILR